MANVNVRMIGRKTLTNSDQFIAAYTTYRDIVTDPNNGLTVPSNGFSPESWDSIGGFWKTVVFMWDRLDFPQSQLLTVFNTWQALGDTHTFDRLNFDISEVPEPPA